MSLLSLNGLKSSSIHFGFTDGTIPYLVLNDERKRFHLSLVSGGKIPVLWYFGTSFIIWPMSCFPRDGTTKSGLLDGTDCKKILQVHLC